MPLFVFFEQDAKIHDLSADKRKDMELMIDSAVENWLNTLKLSEDAKKQLRAGLAKTAEEADSKNLAWEIVCNASEAHSTNVKRIEELVQACNEKEETIKGLLNHSTLETSFGTEASRMVGGKRARTAAETPAKGPEPVLSRDGDAWNTFAQMMQTDSQYY